MCFEEKQSRLNPFHGPGKRPKRSENWGSFFVVNDGGDDLFEKDIEFNVYNHMADNNHSPVDTSYDDSDYNYSSDFDTDDMVSPIVVSYNWALNFGDVASYFDDRLLSDFELSSYEDYSSSFLNLDLHYLLAIDDGLYLSGNIGLSILDHEYCGESATNVMIGTTYKVGAGTGFSLEEVLQMFFGIRVGMASIVQGNYFDLGKGYEQSTFILAVETGLDLVIDILAISCRVDFEYAPFESGDVFPFSSDLLRLNLTVGAGFLLE